MVRSLAYPTFQLRYPPRTYVDCVETLQKIRGVIKRAYSEVSINIIAEETANSTDAMELKGNFTALQEKYAGKLNGTRFLTNFFFSAPEEGRYNGTEQFIRDLDMISLADVLVLSPGYFSSLGAALQTNGIAFSIKHFSHRHDLPNQIVPPSQIVPRHSAAYAEAHFNYQSPQRVLEA